MSSIGTQGLWPIHDWSDFQEWLVHSFAAVDAGDIFEIGPAGEFVYYDDANSKVVPNIQIIGLKDECRLLRLSTSPLSDPLLPSFSVRGVEFWQRSSAEPDPIGGYIVSADCELLAAACVHWFRERWELDFNELGCELHNPSPQNGSDRPKGPRGRPPLHIA